MLRASSTFNTGASINLQPITQNIPLRFTIEVIPVGGTVSVELNGDLVVSWDRGQVGVGNTVNMLTHFIPKQDPTDGGTVQTSFRYLIAPSYSIDFDAVFHNPSQYWGQDAVELRRYIVSGTRSGKIPLGTGPTPAVEHEIVNQINAVVDSLFLLSDSLVVGTTVVDTMQMSYSFTPYPCIRYEVDAQVRTTAAVTVGIENLCLQYAPPTDTLCWAADSVTFCQTTASAQQMFSADVPCAAVQDWVVPFCPVEASGFARVSIGSTLDVLRLELFYTCDPPGSLLPGQLDSISVVPVPSDSTWLDDQNIELKTDRDDMIFTIPVPLDTVTADVKFAGIALSQGDSVVVGRQYTVDWNLLDIELQQCCGGVEDVRLVYRSAEDTHGPANAACDTALTIASNASTGTYTWDPTAISCASAAQKFIVYLEFTCNATGEVLYRARTDWYNYYQ